MLSQKAKSLKPSPTLALAAKAKDLQKQGHDVISLALGEPDWPSFDSANNGGIEAIKSGHTKYTVTAGTLELREAISQELDGEVKIKYSASQIVVGPGAKFILFSALNMICDVGDEVIIPAPYWVSYPTMVELAGGKPVIAETQASNRFKMTATELKKHITPRTKAVILCSPSNPTGNMYTRAELEKLAEVLENHPEILIISDDIYNRLVFSGEEVAPHILQVAPHLKEQTLIVNGASKSYSMTGWRIGWAVGPQALISAMVDFQSQSTSNACSISQMATLAALKKGKSELKQSLENLKARRDRALANFAKIPEVQVANPDGAFYLWVGVDKLFGKKFEGRLIANSKDLCEVYLEKFFVSAVPGVEFGQEGYLRLSYVVSEARMDEAILRFKKLITQLI